MDISERRNAEAALRESEARLNAVIEGAADGILTIDEVGIMRSLNTAAVKMFGYAAEEVIGATSACWHRSPAAARTMAI